MKAKCCFLRILMNHKSVHHSEARLGNINSSSKTVWPKSTIDGSALSTNGRPGVFAPPDECDQSVGMGYHS